MHRFIYLHLTLEFAHMVQVILADMCIDFMNMLEMFMVRFTGT